MRGLPYPPRYPLGKQDSKVSNTNVGRDAFRWALRAMERKWAIVPPGIRVFWLVMLEVEVGR